MEPSKQSGGDPLPDPLELKERPTKRATFPSDLFIQRTLRNSLHFFHEINHPQLQEQLQHPKPGAFVNLPASTAFVLPPRLLRNNQEGHLRVLQRQIFIDLQNFVLGKRGLTYVHGPQGYGKSFALYHLVCYLSTFESVRVLYIPDCSILNLDAFTHLFRAIVAAFARDEEFVHSIADFASRTDSTAWSELQEIISAHCEDNQLQFYAIFDQHNGLSAEIRSTAPTNLHQWARELTIPHFRLVISASANNSDQPLLTETSASFEFCAPFSSTEFTSWRTEHNFYPEETSMDALINMTGNIPLELDEVRFLSTQAPPLTFPDLLANYRLNRVQQFQDSHTKYLLENGATPPECAYGSYELDCMLRMAAGLPVSTSVLRFDRQLFYVKFSPETRENYLLPTCPLALEMVSNRLRTLAMHAQ